MTGVVVVLFDEVLFDVLLLVPLVFPPCWLKKELLFWDDEFEFELVCDDPDVDCVDWVVVVLTWCMAISPSNMPKPIIEATASDLLRVLANARARALGIFTCVDGLCPTLRCGPF